MKGAQISISRLEEYCKQPEIDPPSTALPPPESDPDVVLSMSNAEFKWDGDLEHPHITDLSVELKRGQVIAVVGDVGSGKSFLAAVMGQIKQTAGTVNHYGYASLFVLLDPLLRHTRTFGYVPQEPWLIDATIRDNIMFGLDIEEAKYLDTIRLVGLTRDLMLLSNGVLLSHLQFLCQ
jgi:ABC-type bacteriocin/lantibiotic exporter with double-glycine peptidase domain